MHQCKLSSGDAVMITWLSNDKEFKVGDWVTLKDSDEPDRRWRIVVKGDPNKRDDVKMTWKSQDIKRDGSRAKVL